MFHEFLLTSFFGVCVCQHTFWRVIWRTVDLHYHSFPTPIYSHRENTRLKPCGWAEGGMELGCGLSERVRVIFGCLMFVFV